MCEHERVSVSMSVRVREKDVMCVKNRRRETLCVCVSCQCMSMWPEKVIQILTAKNRCRQLAPKFGFRTIVLVTFGRTTLWKQKGQSDFAICRRLCPVSVSNGGH